MLQHIQSLWHGCPAVLCWQGAFFIYKATEYATIYSTFILRRYQSVLQCSL